LMGSVAELGTTVVLSSHLLGDLERVCDYLIVLQAAQVQVLGAVEDLLSGHKMLIGPRREPSTFTGAVVVQARHTDKQTTLLVRTEGDFERSRLERLHHDPEWTVEDIALEDLVLAYLADPSAGALPGPARTDPGVRR